MTLMWRLSDDNWLSASAKPRETTTAPAHNYSLYKAQKIPFNCIQIKIAKLNNHKHNSIFKTAEALHAMQHIIKQKIVQQV
ncbi:hypothetical protein B5X24_HaOG216690 [Helicoverpa armigera]|nr:hypothetical protein B5X24_HaOG216690 [Helicoverpa armigera]